jgi:hypothetical protein
MSIGLLALRTWLRYLAPLTLLALIAGVALAWSVHRAGAPTDVDQARAEIRIAWTLAGTAWMIQLALVAAVAPAVRGLARGAPLTQAGALAAGARDLVRGLVPCAIAIVAIVLGGLALVVPGLALLALFAMTGASDRLGDPLPAPLVDAARVARAHLPAIAAVVAAMIALDLAIGLAAHLAILPAWPKKPAIGLLAPVRTFVRVVGLALIAAAPLPACLIAAVYERRRSIPNAASAARTSSASRATRTHSSRVPAAAAFAPYQIACQPTPSAPSMSAAHESPMCTGRAPGSPSCASVYAKIRGSGFSIPSRPESTIAANGSAMPMV